MSFEFKLPDIGEGVMEGEIVEWHVEAGSNVEADEPIVSVLTDKATVEISAPQSGTIREIRGSEGDGVNVGDVIAVFGESEDQPAKSEESAPPSNAQAQPKASSEGGTYPFKLPEIGEGVMEGEIVEWLVSEGDQVSEDQPIVSVLTDKATVEITAPVDGVVASFSAANGDVIEVGQVIVTFETSADVGAPQQQAPAEPKPAKAVEKPDRARQPARAVDPSNNPSISAFGTPLATPAVRKLAAEKDIDLTRVRGTGPHNRITRADVESATGGSTTATRTASPQTPAASVAPSQGERREPIKGLRKAIYTNMARAKQIIPHFTYVEEVEMDRLVRMRAGLKQEAADEGVKLTYLPFIAKAIALSLKKFPILNASVDDEAGEIVYKGDYNLGVATATEHGLMVPVVKHVDRKNVLQLAQEIGELAERARKRRSSPEDLSGGTFTITSLGRLGGLLATPIINHPEVGIFGIHNIVDRAVVRDGEIVIRKMMNVAVAFDHRVVDGDVGASFTQDVRSYLENPDKLLLHLS